MPSGGNNSLETVLAPYTTPVPEIANRYQQNLERGGFLDLPSFMEMYDSWRKLGEREANRQTAGINEAFGSQGARYSSDLLGAQGRVKENLFDQLASKGAEYQSGLRQQQFGEVSALTGLQYGASEAGMTRYFQDFLRRTSPPPGYEGLLNLGNNYGLPPVVV